MRQHSQQNLQSNMPAVLRRINRIFRRNSRDQNVPNMNVNNAPNSHNPAAPSSNRNLHRHRNNSQLQHNNGANINGNNMEQDGGSSEDVMYGPSPIKLRSTGYKRQTDGSVTLSVTLDKDQVECCVCLSSMTGAIYRCRGNGPSNSHSNMDNAEPPKKMVCHNICSSCQWQMRRMKSGNGHTKEMQCPICKVKGKFVRNRALERQLLELSQECEHSKYGCSHRFFPWDDNRDLHEKHLCIYQSIDCPFCYQTISGGRVNFVEHLVKSGAAAVQDINEDNESMIDDQEMADNAADADADQEIDSENEIDFMNDDSANILNNEDGAQEAEDEEKEAINNELEEDDDMLMDGEKKGNNKAQHVVPTCLLQWHESKSCLDLNQNERNVISQTRNEFVVNYNLGIILCFIAPSSACPCWKVYTLSISPRHGTGGNSRVYVQYYDDETMNTFMEKEQSLGLITQSLARPVTNTLILNLARLHPTSLRKVFASYPSNNPFVAATESNTKKIEINEMKEETNSMQLDECELDDLEEYRPIEFLGESPCTPIQCGFICMYGGHDSLGNNSLINALCVRVFTLEESLKVGSVIDARDFTGKWYQAEVITVKDSDGNEYTNLDYDNDDYLEIRKAKIHYLGYSQNYDEWLFVDTDSHRIAQRGTFTVGPDLRAIRRNTTNLAAQHPIHAAQHRHHHIQRRSAASNRNNNNNNPSLNPVVVDVEPEN